MPPNPVSPNAPAVTNKEARITALSVLKGYYDEEVFTLLVKDIYNADIDISVAAIRASGSLGNEVAVQHLYQMVERGKTPQKIAAVQSLMAIRAPSATGMLVKYFSHFAEEDLRAEILRAIDTISPSSPQVIQMNQAVFSDPKQGESVKSIAVAALVDVERYSALKDALPRASAAVQRAALAKMVQAGSPDVPELRTETLAPAALGDYMCLYALKARNPQTNLIVETLQNGPRETTVAFLDSLNAFQGRLRYPARLLRLLLVVPYVDPATEALVGDFLKKVVGEVREGAPQLVSEFSVITSAHIDTVFAKVRKNYISLRGITNKSALMATVLAMQLERYASPQILADVQAFFKDDGSKRLTPPIAQIRDLLGAAPKEDQNRFEACIPLFLLEEKADRFTVLQQVNRVDLNRPSFMRRLNRLIRVAGALRIRTASKKIQEILDFARAERIKFLEETCIVTLCQLLTRSIIEQSREYFLQPSRNPGALNGYIRGARFIDPPRILLGPLVHVAQNPALPAASRALLVDTLEAIKPADLQGLQRTLQPILKVLDLPTFEDQLKLRVADVVGRAADAGIGQVALDLTSHPTPAGRRAAIRIVKALAVRSAGAPGEIVTNRLYLLLEDTDRAVRVEALQALLAVGDDYSGQIVTDYIRAGDGQIVSELLEGLGRPLRRETFALVLEMLGMEHAGVQASLRKLLPELAQGPFAEELKQGLAACLTQATAESRRAEPAAAREEELPDAESTLAQAKLEFKFKRESRQSLTVFFIDIVNYTEKTTQLPPSEMMKLIKSFEDIVSEAVDEYQGRVVKKMGDGILASFKMPVAAAAAAIQVQKKLTEYSAMKVGYEKVEARIGLNTGEVTRRGKDIFGDVVNVASRMQSAATPGEVFLTEDTFKEIRSYVKCTELGKIKVKGITDPITAYSALDLTADPSKVIAPGAEPRLEQLKESIFVPTFTVPATAADKEKLTGLLKEIFSEVSRAVEELAADYHDEYEFKKYLQEKWNALMESL